MLMAPERPSRIQSHQFQFSFLPELQSVSFHAVILKLVQENTRMIT